MNEKNYYYAMEHFEPTMSFEEIHDKWYRCFYYILKSFKVGFGTKSIISLFYDFDMDNWKDLHKENTEYKESSKEDLINKFCSECFYISDRTSYDRLFRTHWLFRQAFNDELNRLLFPSLYEEEK